MQDTLPAIDPFAAHFATPPVLAALVEKGALGQKTGAGFYQARSARTSSCSTRRRPTTSPRERQGRRAGRTHPEEEGSGQAPQGCCARSTNPQAQFLWAIFRDAFHYIAVHLDTHRRQRARRRLRAALGLRLDRSARSRPGRRPAGSRSPSGSRKTSTRARRCRRRRCRTGYSKARSPRPTACIPRKARGRPAQKSFVGRSTLPVYERQPFRAPLLGEGAPTGHTGGTTSSRTTTAACGHSRATHVPRSSSVDEDQDARDRPGVIAGLPRASSSPSSSTSGLVIWNADAPRRAVLGRRRPATAMLPVFMSGGAKAIGPEERKLQNALMR